MSPILIPLSIGLFLVVYFAAFMLHQIYERQNVVDNTIRNSREKLNAIKRGDQKFISAFGETDRHSIVFKYDRLFLLSGLKRPMTAELYFFIVVLLMTVMFVIGSIIRGLLLGVYLFFAAGVAGYLFLAVRANKRYDKIEDATPTFISILSNEARSSSDIVSIMQRTALSIEQPMRYLALTFVANANAYGSSDIAFDLMKQSVDNHQLRLVITNLKTCSHYEANYEDVLQQMMQQTAMSLSAREQRKEKLMSGKVTVALMTIMTAIILFLIASTLEIDIVAILFGTTIGRALVFVQGLIYLVVIVFLFSVDKER